MSANELPTADSVPGLDWLSQSEPLRSARRCLVIAWSLEEAHRLGEVATLAPGVNLLGRGSQQSGDPGARLLFGKEPDGGTALSAAGISRVHVLFRHSADTTTFERRGRASLRLNGRACDAGTLEEGDVLTLDKQLVLFCVSRLAHAPRERASTPFGHADAYGLVGESDAIWTLRTELAQAATSSAHVLLLGPSGSGKELCARALHGLSRRSGPLVSRNAATFPATLIDAELFGNAKGFPNTGTPERVGLVGAASGGTLFLDEIGDLSQSLSAHLLRVLDRSGEYQRLGESTVRHADLRLVAATNRGVSALKSDFAARFLVRVQVPGLDARREDIPLIVRHILEDMAKTAPHLRARYFDEATQAFRIDPDFVEVLLRMHFELNVRRLGELLWRSAQQSRVPYLRAPEPLDEPSSESQTAKEDDAPVRREPSEAEIRSALAKHQGKPGRASQELGLSSRFALYRLMRKHGIQAKPDSEG